MNSCNKSIKCKSTNDKKVLSTAFMNEKINMQIMVEGGIKLT